MLLTNILFLLFFFFFKVVYIIIILWLVDDIWYTIILLWFYYYLYDFIIVIISALQTITLQSFMQPFNPFIERNQGRLNEFFMAMTKTKSETVEQVGVYSSLLVMASLWSEKDL